jgi:predicted phage terminase large subunit-like protein
MGLPFEMRARQARGADGEQPAIPTTAPDTTGTVFPATSAVIQSTGGPARPAPTARWLARQDPDLVGRALRGFSESEVAGLPYLWDFWAMPHQLPPAGAWRTWVILGGRGAGKTRAGAEWVRAQVEGPRPRDPGRCKRIALLGETIDQAREVMVFGDSGIMACSPPDRRPKWHATRRMLEWPNGATAQLFSAHDPESLRGPQFDGAWADELAKWKKGEEAWDMLQFGLRLGDDPRCVVTTTPRDAPVLKTLLDQPSTRRTHAKTEDNRANLARGFMQEMETRFAGTRLGRQELDGELLEDMEGALWSHEMIDAARVDFVPRLDRVLVAVDPAVSTGKRSDSTGILVVGVTLQGATSDWHAYVLEDATVQGASPDEWGAAVIRAVRRHKAGAVVAEVNQGGAMVESILKMQDSSVPVIAVRAAEGKITRAEPVAALYEQHRVHHPRGTDLTALEDQLTRMTVGGYRGKGSPDRVDALVWALHESILTPARAHANPKIRGL